MIKDLKALVEMDAELVNPEIHTGKGTLTIQGSIASGHYLHYQGGDKAVVYDENWNKVRNLPVNDRGCQILKGWEKVSVTTASTGPKPWLEVQFMTRGNPMTVKIQ